MGASRAIDVIGDIHGELPALLALGRELGYRVEDGWEHPQGRLPFFLGDLIDRGGHSLEVAELARELVTRGRAACLMGNHEYNIVAFSLRLPGYEKPKSSNRETIPLLKRQPARWEPVLDFMRGLPLACALPDLRLIHACWHEPSLALVAPALKPGHPDGPGFAVVLESPFDERGLKPGLPAAEPGQSDAPHELLLKGYEAPCDAFLDVDGKRREAKRVTWWSETSAPVPRDRPMAVGHYWNLPPIDGQFCPPYPPGHPELRRWQDERASMVPDRGRRILDRDVACVDFNGLTEGSRDRACVGALRWPEREVVWATGPRTRPKS